MLTNANGDVAIRFMPENFFGVLLRLIFCTYALAVVPQAFAAIPASERTVLVNVYNQTNGAAWKSNTNWNGAAGTECIWYGITCDATETHVIGVSLGGNNLSGSLPAIAALSALQNFDVSGPNFNGSVDDPIDAADQGQISGSIPALSALSNLQSFYANNNHLTGSIPALIGLKSLTYFEAGNNGLTGSIPSLDGLSNLFNFEVQANQLSGTIPPLAGAPQLRDFIVAHNALNGSIPPLSGLTKLDDFLLEGNQLSGSIPPIAGIDSLYVFNVSHNYLTGTIPPLTGIPELYLIDVSFNLLSGDVPAAPFSPYPHNYGTSALCPNLLNHSESSEWNSLTDSDHWYLNCLPANVNLNQFGLSGSWFNPATGGQGFLLQGFPDLIGAGQGVVSGGWFTFSPISLGSTAAPLPQWYTLQGTVDSRLPYVELGIYSTEGGNFAAPPALNASPVGIAIFALDDCTHGTLAFSIEDFPVPPNAISLTRLSPNTTCSPSGDNGAPASDFLLSGAWFDPNNGGQGLMFDINPSINLLSAAWYTFASDGSTLPGWQSQRWFTLQSNSFKPGATSVQNVGIYTASGGIFNDPTPVTTTQVGTADISFSSCSAMILVYRFSAGENAGKNGSISLTRIGPPPTGCHL
jgi:hypothetical protein